MTRRFQKDVEVIGVGHAIGSLDGSELYQVGFGEIGKPKSLPPNAAIPKNAKVAAAWMVIFIPKEGQSPYAMGSRWRLTVEPSGKVTLSSRRGRR